jgi:hypothetical protein
MFDYVDYGKLTYIKLDAVVVVKLSTKIAWVTLQGVIDPVEMSVRDAQALLLALGVRDD